MLVQGQLLLPDDVSGVRLACGQLLIERGHIARIAVFDVKNNNSHRIGSPDLGSDRCLISPGFIDAHLHLPQFDSIGVDGLTLLDWLNAAIFPAEARWEDPDFAEAMAARVTRRLLAAGTTGIAAYATVHHESCVRAMRVLSNAGLRGYVGQVLMDQHAPAELLRPAAQLLKEAGAFQDHPARIAPIVSPRFAITCSRELLAGAGGLAHSTGWMIQTHLAETSEECRRVRELHGAEYLEVYQQAGLLTARSLLGHSIWLNDTELRTMSSAGAVAAHCPGANLFLQAGRFDRARASRVGVRVALGSDVAGGPDVSMVRVARAMIETAKRVGPDHATPAALPSARDAWHQITRGNALALGLENAGRLHVGDPADVLVIDPGVGPAAEPDWLYASDPLAKLLYAWDDRWISRVICEGVVRTQSER